MPTKSGMRRLLSSFATGPRESTHFLQVSPLSTCAQFHDIRTWQGVIRRTPGWDGVICDNCFCFTANFTFLATVLTREHNTPFRLDAMALILDICGRISKKVSGASFWKALPPEEEGGERREERYIPLECLGRFSLCLFLGFYISLSQLPFCFCSLLWLAMFMTMPWHSARTRRTRRFCFFSVAWLSLRGF